MSKHVNYFLPGKYSRLINGHIDAKDLYDKILNHDGSTAYACYFDLQSSFLKFELDTLQLDKENKKIYKYILPGEKIKDPSWINNGKSFTEYEGPARPAMDFVSFDFDDADNLENTLAHVRAFVEWLDLDNLLIFFSGSKGFHVMIPFGYFPLEENEHLPNQLKSMADYLKKNSYPSIDTSIYNYNRKFRVPFTLHEKTNLYKTLISYNELFELTMEQIMEKAKVRKVVDFKTIINYSLIDKKHDGLIQLWEESKRVSYEVEKDKGGTLIKPTQFEKFDNKLCIKKMLNTSCNDIGRNNACMRIVNDYYRTGKTRSKCEKDLQKWISENGLPEKELNQIISDIYDRGGNYNFGCQDECKSSYCSAKCSIWKKLSPDKRPQTVDMPLSAIGESSDNEGDEDDVPRFKKEFYAVKFIMEKIFNGKWDSEKQCFYDSDCVKANAEDFFYYTENHWQILDEIKIQFLKTRLNAHYGNKLTPRQIDNIWKMLILYIPSKPEEVDLFSPRDDVANFLDGTVHLIREGDKYDLVFRNHNKYDYCTNIFDLKFNDYLENPDRKNNKFESWLHTVLDHDLESFNLIQEMYGASLMPKFPKLFFLLGQSSTGKSTTIKILKRMHRNEKNISGVSPDSFFGFNLMTMVGKLINIVMDIKTDADIADDVVKQIDDGQQIRIPQKNKVDIYAKIPNLHVFGANKLPKTKEGYSGAMKRRAEIINFDKAFVGKINRNIANDLFDADPIGVFCFAIRGLKRLVQENNGNYSTSAKSKRAVESWEAAGNALLTFVDDMSSEGLSYAGEVVKYVVDDSERLRRGDLWEHFKKWQIENLPRFEQYGRMRFNAEVENQFPCRRMKDSRYVLGIGIEGKKDISI